MIHVIILFWAILSPGHIPAKQIVDASTVTHVALDTEGETGNFPPKPPVPPPPPFPIFG